jgi:rfaE bifunctional protein kinase chain/domain
MLSQRLDDLAARFAGRKILVLGDLMLDEFLRGKVSRISPEAPVPVVEVLETAHFPGGAANVARNLCSIGAKPGLAGVIGADEDGRVLMDLLQSEGAGVAGIVISPARPTTHKLRIVARQQQVVRVDRESKAPLSAEEQERLLAYLAREIASHEAVIIEDYGKGLINQDVANAVIRQAKETGKIVTIDPNPHNPLDWSGATAIKPNRQEAFQSAGRLPTEAHEDLLAVAEKLRAQWKSRYLLVTLGEEGMLLMEDGKKPYHTPTKAKEVYDVSGAGDTAIAVFTLALAAGANGIEAAEIANHAAGVVVGKLGTATLTVEELKASFAKNGS